MKFAAATFATLALTASSVLATPTVQDPPTVVRRDADSAASSIIASVDKQVVGVDNAIKAYNGGSDISNIQSLVTALINYTNSGAKQVAANGNINDAGVEEILPEVQSLVNDVKQAVTDLIAKKAPAVSAGLDNTIETDLTSLKSAADALGAALEQAVSADGLSAAAAMYVSSIDSALESGISAFSGAGGSATATPTGSSSSSSASSGSATATATATGSASSHSGTMSITGKATTTSCPTSLVTSTTSCPSSSASVSPSASSSSVAVGSTTPSVTSMPGSIGTPTTVPSLPNMGASSATLSLPAGLLAAFAALLAF